MKSWRELNRTMNLLTEEALQELLDDELSGERRVNFVIRYHQRLNTLRVARERIELLRRIT